MSDNVEYEIIDVAESNPRSSDKGGADLSPMLVVSEGKNFYSQCNCII